MPVLTAEDARRISSQYKIEIPKNITDAIYTAAKKGETNCSVYVPPKDMERILMLLYKNGYTVLTKVYTLKFSTYEEKSINFEISWGG